MKLRPASWLPTAQQTAQRERLVETARHQASTTVPVMMLRR
jgi:hypothetical protein